MAIITSSEIKNAAFEHTTFRGYNPEQVDRILDNAAETVDSLTRENTILNEKVRALSAQVESMRGREGSLNEIMMRAQKMHDDIIAEAKEKSALLIAESEKKSNDLLMSAKNLGEAKVSEYKEEIRIEKAKLKEAREEAANFIDMICGELNAKAEMIAKIKVKANLEDIETRPVQFKMPEEEMLKTEPELAESIQEVKVVTPIEADMPIQPKENVEKKPSEDAIFDFSSVVDAAQSKVSKKEAPKEEPIVPIVDDIANIISDVQETPVAPASKGMSWDEIIGLKSAPKSASNNNKNNEEDSALKFGKEFDITIQ